jgi:hypothetical protein
MAKCSFANDELGCVCSVETVDAICPCNSILYFWHERSAISIVEEAGCGYHIFRNIFERANDVLISTLRSATHIPCFVDNLLISWEKLVEIIYCICKFVQQFRLSWCAFSSFHQVEDINWRTISLEQIIEVESSCAIEWVNEIELDRWLWSHPSVTLSPIQRDTASMLNIRSQIWVGEKLWTRSVERSCLHI